MKIFFLVLLYFSFHAQAEEEAIPLSHIFTKIPSTSKTAAKTAFSEDALPYWGVILGTTAITYYYDEKISSNIRYHATNWDINRHYQTHNAFDSKGNLLNFPRDLGSMLYFSGDGFIHIAAAGTFIGVGKLTKNNYTANTGTMILHGLTMTGIYAQLLKRSFGRESPVEKTSPRGGWHFFPSFHAYQSNTAKYDAMPSGHMMTATLTFTILANRYEEYAIPIWALGGVWIGSLGFQMINNGVHWASDFPLGIAMGYLIGKSVLKMNKPSESNKTDASTVWTIYPGLTNGVPSVNGYLRF
jgi:membrane-associated phospholipid phosphatase